jgi:hypothetical protein
MFNLEIYRQHWMFFSIAFGGVVMFTTVLWYLAVWRERGAEKRAQAPITDVKSFALWFQRAFPWILILTILGTFLFSIVYPQLRAIHPPNW